LLTFRGSQFRFKGFEYQEEEEEKGASRTLLLDSAHLFAIKAAITPAEVPESMFTTEIPKEQACNMLIRAASPSPPYP
jgi:hypothetical protein